MRDITKGHSKVRGTAGAALALAGAATGLLLQGCGTLSSTQAVVTPPVTIAATSPQGTVMGGQQPVAGIALQLYVVGTTYGGAASKLGPSFVTVASGNFTFPAYTCPSPGALVFLVGNGGTPIGGSANPNLALMAGLGACSTVGSTFVVMNELTTVATVYALAGFMTGPTNIGAPASNALGIANAFAAINKVVNIATGLASGPALPTGATLPVMEINALGNILQNCVNSSGGTAGDSNDGYTTGTPCGKLFYLTKNGTTTPTETITATMLLAQNPGLPAAGTPTYVAKLNDLQASSPAFSPALNVNAPPTDWTIAITYTGGGLSSPHAIATDASGNVFVANQTGNLTKLSSTGAAISGPSGFSVGGVTQPYGLAIDQQGYVWVTNGNNTISVVDPSGNAANSINLAGNSAVTSPEGIAIDGAGNAWVAMHGNNTVVELTLNAARTQFTTAVSSAGGITTPPSIAINPK